MFALPRIGEEAKVGTDADEETDAKSFSSRGSDDGNIAQKDSELKKLSEQLEKMRLDLKRAEPQAPAELEMWIREKKETRIKLLREEVVEEMEAARRGLEQAAIAAHVAHEVREGFEAERDALVKRAAEQAAALEQAERDAVETSMVATKAKKDSQVD